MAENRKRSLADILIDAGAAVINGHDKAQLAMDRAFLKAYHGVALFLHNRRASITEHKPKLLQYLAIIVLTAIAVLAIYNYGTAYEYSYHGRMLGYVKNQEDVIKVLDLTSSELSKEHGAKVNIEVGEDITFRRAVAIRKDIDNADMVLKRLTYLTNMRADAYGIYVNGKYVMAVASKSQAKDVLQSLKDNYETYTKKKKTSYDSITFMDKVNVKAKSVKLTSILSDSKALDQLIKDKTIRVATVEKSTFAEVVKYKTVVKKSKSMYRGNSKVTQKGKNGKRVVTARITKVNGKQVKRVDLKIKTLKHMQKKIIVKGTKKRPKTAPTGTFIMPVNSYTLSSTFGYRWGSMHEGIDLAAATGTAIHASDGGRVVRAGWYSGYGKCIDISHGNGYMTRYGHCSRIIVKVGQRVYQGQKIGEVGNTGNSTGSHCHFEIRINGTAKNPLKYVK